MSEFERGQLVYVSDNQNDWHIGHYADSHYVYSHIGEEFPYTVSLSYTKALKGDGEVKTWKYCLSVEDYHKMLNEPKDKELVWAWNTSDSTCLYRAAYFYDAKDKGVFKSSGHRGGVAFDNYEVIPIEHWPQWAIEVYKHLEN